MTQVIGPGSTVGILGAGQLGRMLAISARQMGYRVAVYGGDQDSPCGQVSDLAWDASFEDEDRLKEFAAAADVVTYEFENISARAAAAISSQTPLHPAVSLLETAQNRFAEKSSLAGMGLDTARFQMVSTADELASARDRFGGTVILKANTDGYDGKGQWLINDQTDVKNLWDQAGLDEAIVEEKVGFQFELSIIGGRYADGSCHFYRPLLNLHANHILDVSISGAPQVTQEITTAAEQIARAILEHFDVVGVLCVELFLMPDGHLLVNEIAPRPHNSGHLTIEAYNCSQFELQLRSICGLPAVDLQQRVPAAAMANLLGQHLPGDWHGRNLQSLETSGTSLHLYGKPEARQNRKMGHITHCGYSVATAEQLVRSHRETLTGAAKPQHHKN